MSKERKPLKIFTKLLRWFCDPRLYEEMEGDLWEGFQTRIKKRGRFIANFIYAIEVMAMLRPSVIRPQSRMYKSRPLMMLASYFKITRRSFLRNKTYVGINVIGMGIGLACCIATYMNYQFNTSYDEGQINISSLYRLNYTQEEDKKDIHYAVTSMPIGPQAAEFSGVLDLTRYAAKRGSIRVDNDYFDFRMGFADASFLEMFTFPLLYGDPQVLSDPSSIVISKKTSLKYFGVENAIGETITYLDRGEEKQFIVRGILEDLPLNSSFRFNGLTSLQTLPDLYGTDFNSWDQFITTFLLIEDDKAIPALTAAITELVAERDPDGEEARSKIFYLDPLPGMASRAANNDLSSPLKEAMPWPIYVVPAGISLLILLVTTFTFVNTFIASAARRLKEIGIRKVMGGRRSQIIAQFIGESIAICILALIVALPISNLLVEQYGSMLPFYEIEFNHSWDFIGFLALLIIGVGVLAGSYPALYISQFQPAGILKGESHVKGVGRLSKVLLGAQFGFSMLALVSSVLFIQNAQYQNDVDLGFDTDETVVVRLTGGAKQYAPLMNHLQQNPKVEGITGAGDHVGRRFHTALARYQSEEFEIVEMNIGENYIDLIELQLVAGRDFNADLQSDYQQSIIVNESFVQQMQWESAIGQQLTLYDSSQYFVIGVVKDFYFDSFNSEIQPLVLNFKHPSDFRYLIARTAAPNVASLTEETKMAWKEVFHSHEYDIDPGSNALYEGTIINTIILKLFVFMGSIAVIMSLIGLFSLISLNLTGRMKEIGIRKVLGASVPTIIKVVNRDYALILLLGIAIGSVVSYFLIPAMMSAMWAYHIDAGLSLFAISIFLMVLVSTATVGLKVLNAAQVNPSDLLRDE